MKEENKKTLKNQPEEQKIKNNIPLKTVKLFRGIAKRVAPPPKLTISQWADKYRKLSSESSSESGQWRTDRAPYQREIMDAISDPSVETVVIMTSSQVGKTEILLNTMGYYIDYDPAPMMLILPTLALAQDFSKDRIAPMIRDTPSLKGKVKDSKSKDSSNTILHKSFPGGRISIAGANSAPSLSSKPVRIILADEVDRYPASAGTEGDPISLAVKRTTSFWNRKKVFVSTPTDKGLSRIEQAYEDSSMEQCHLPCPVCGEYQPLVWNNIKFIDEEYDHVTHQCIYCKARSGEYAWKDGKEKWISRKENYKVRGFHLNELYSPIGWKDWETIVEEFKTAYSKGHDQYKVWINTALGESWEDRGESVKDDALLKRREEYKCEVPDDVLVLTCAVDVQKNRLETEVVGWGVGKESWGIEHKTIMGNPEQDQVWNLLDLYLKKTWSYSDGVQIGLSCTCVDSGYCTTRVYKFCKGKDDRRIFAIKGVGGPGRPLVSKHSYQTNEKIILFPLGVDSGKQTIVSNLKLKEPGEGYCHFPIEPEKGYDEDYFKGLTSEKKVIRTIKGQPYFQWVKKPGVERNEPFDLRNYNLAALEIFNPPLDQISRQERGLFYKRTTVKQDSKGNKTKVRRRRVISKGVR